MQQNDSREWLIWQDEQIWWDCQKIRSRRSCIRQFVQKGLFPFLDSKGYKFKRSLEAITNDIANGLFENRGRSCLDSNWQYNVTNTNFVEEDHWHWGDVLSDEVWAEFWATWGHWEDVSLDSYRGQDRRIDIQHYSWTQIDLDNSPASDYVNELFNYVEEDNDTPSYSNAPWKRVRDDSYIREAAESGEWGGYRR